MGYNPTASVVERFAPTLEEIKQAIDAGREISFAPPPDGLSLYSLSEKLSNFLRSAQRYPQAANGRYQDLRDRTTVSVDWTRDRVTLRPKGHTMPGSILTSQAPHDRDMIEVLRSSTNPFETLNFKPSPGFKLSIFEKVIETMGWTIRNLVDDPGDPDDPFFPAPPRKAGELNDNPPQKEGWLSFNAIRQPKD